MATDQYADSHRGPRKMGVYEGSGTTRSQMPMVLAGIAAVVVLLLLWVFIQ